MTGHAAVLETLADGEITVIGRIVESSNNALLVSVGPVAGHEASEPIQAIYKPTRGERPLDDFPIGTLTRREVAAWLVSEATGWGIVPPTVLRDGPFGEGMIQAFAEADPDVDVVAMILDDDPRLRRMAAFDAAVNNTDRKGGHIVPVAGGDLVYGVDHGVCFSTVPKLRTVLWAWRGQPLADDEIQGLERIRVGLAGPLALALATLLSAHEVEATVDRVAGLLRDRRFPLPSPTWPAVPWPPF